MTVEQMYHAADWLIKNTDPEDGIYTLEQNELGLAIYLDTGLTRRNVGYVRMSDGRVVLWWPKRKVSV